jgi:hypothetical protein
VIVAATRRDPVYLTKSILGMLLPPTEEEQRLLLPIELFLRTPHPKRLMIAAVAAAIQQVAVRKRTTKRVTMHKYPPHFFYHFSFSFSFFLALIYLINYYYHHFILLITQDNTRLLQLQPMQYTLDK